jgi:hypothetical protein
MKLLTCDDVEARLREIEANKHDDEIAHKLEDELYRAVLLSIASGAPKARSLARRTIKVLSINFCRWHA